jgi:hypothetical protein
MMWLRPGKLSLVGRPFTIYSWRLITTEDGGLGFAEVDWQFTLKLRSMVTGPEGKWGLSRAIDLSAVNPVHSLL